VPKEYSDDEVREIIEYYQDFIGLSTAVMAGDQQVVEMLLDSIDLRSFARMTVTLMLNDLEETSEEDIAKIIEMMRKPPSEMLPEIGHKVAEMQTWFNE
jgi:hypothetical protein